MSTCKYDRAWVGVCGSKVVDGEHFCKDHLGKACSSCGDQASHECSHTGQFVCGAPLCSKCTGAVDLTKPSGSWGFLNHYHCRTVDKK